MLKDEIKSTEMFMYYQFIDVIEVIEKYEKIEDIKNDLKKRKKIYVQNIKKMSENKDFLSINLDKESIDDRIEKYKENNIKNIEYSDVHLAYKIGLIDGMKLKSRCT